MTARSTKPCRHPGQLYASAARRQLHPGIRELALKNGNGGREVALLALCESDATVDVGPDRGIRARLRPAHVADVPFTQGSAVITIGHEPLTLGLSRKRRDDTRDKHDCCNTRHKKLLVVLPFMLSEWRFFMLCERHFVGGPMHNSRNCGTTAQAAVTRISLSINTTRRRLPSMK